MEEEAPSQTLVVPDEPSEQLQVLALSALACTYDDAETSRRRFAHALATLRDDFFTGRYATVWQMCRRYFTVAKAAPSPEDFDELIGSRQEVPLADRVEYAQLYRMLADQQVSDARFRFVAARLIDRWRDTQFASALVVASSIHTGAQRVGDKMLAGYEDSLAYLRTEMARVDRLASPQAPESRLRDDGSELMSQYMQAKVGYGMGVLTGIAEVDTLTHGFRPGELVLLAGFSGEGKSKMAYQIAWHTAYVQRKNVLFFTAEVVREQVRRNLAVRHSHLEKFGRPGGLKATPVRFGQLGPDDEEVYRAVVRDLAAPEYGELVILQVPHRTNVEYLWDRLEHWSRLAKPDLIIVDYLGLLGSSSKRIQRREELDDILIAAKRMATDALDGHGVPLVSPWQLSREAWKQAQDTGEYTKAALADTSQAERSSDFVLSLLRFGNEPNTLHCQILKARDAEADLKFRLYADYSTGIIQSENSMADLLT